ncbi:unnamed protein product [Prunus armeniaca]
MAATSDVCVSLNLLIDTKSHKILFAEVSKEVADFFFPLLAVFACWHRKLYASLENLSYTYLQPNLNKNTLLRPKSVVAEVGGMNILEPL